MSTKSETYDVAQDIWKRKYAYEDEASIKETMLRVAKAIGGMEQDSEKWINEFASILTTLEFLPGGRIIANAGTKRTASTMFNCYVMGDIVDSMKGIYGAVTEAAITQQQGGGVGFDFSSIRPDGANVKGCEAKASGPLSFMQVFDSSCRTIMAAGNRRGAQMGVLRCDHPDIEKFITAKRGNENLRMFNLSVGITDAFIEAVKADKDWDLVFDATVYKTIKAKELWDQIMKSTYDFAEPGFLLLDKINRENNLNYCETIKATNPCVVRGTTILTKEYGEVAIESVLDQPLTIWNGYQWSTDVVPQITGYNQPILRVDFSNGGSITCTDYHGFYLRNRTEKLEAKFLAVGDTLEQWYIPSGEPQPYLMSGIQVMKITPMGIEDVVYCFSEPLQHRGVFNGIMTANCGEQPLPPYGACLLGSVNLTKFVRNPFEKDANVDLHRLAQVVKIAVRLLDNVIDYSIFPLKAQEEEAKQKRRMGIGITGLADTLIMLGLKYDTDRARECAGSIMRIIDGEAYASSVFLAKEKGAFPAWDKTQYGAHFKKVLAMTSGFEVDYELTGIRNSHLTSIAPTGTISMLAGNVSSGLEPVFAYAYDRKIRNTIETDTTTVSVEDYAYKLYCEKMGRKVPVKELPEYFVDASSIDPMDHLRMQATLQGWVDSSISKTINVPADYPFVKFKDLYMKAWELGCKGCTTFRPSENFEGILIKKEDKKIEAPAPVVVTKVKRPYVLSGKSYKIKTPMGHSYFVIINDIMGGNGKMRPYEIFINSKQAVNQAWVVALARLTSAVFHHDSDPSFIVEELKTIQDNDGGWWEDGKFIPSLISKIGSVIEAHINALNGAPVVEELSEKEQETEIEKTNIPGMVCPSCNERTLIQSEGCAKCFSCNYSKCS